MAVTECFELLCQCLVCNSVVAIFKIERRLLSVKFDLSLFVLKFMITNVCSHKYVIPNSANNFKAKSLILPYLSGQRFLKNGKMLHSLKATLLVQLNTEG